MCHITNSEREGCGSLWDSILHSWECDVDKNEVSDTTNPEKKHKVFLFGDPKSMAGSHPLLD